MRSPAILLLAVLAGCAAPPPANTPQAQCQQQADKDPAVQALLVQAPVNSQDVIWQTKLSIARRTAVNSCLAAKGLAPRGGVQPVFDAPYGLD